MTLFGQMGAATDLMLRRVALAVLESAAERDAVERKASAVEPVTISPASSMYSKRGCWGR
jgi:hypothetical protein